MYEEYFSVDEASPVVDALKFEASLYRLILELAEMVVYVGTIEMERLEEIESGVESQDGILGVAVHDLLAIYTPILLVEVYSLWQKVVGIEG